MALTDEGTSSTALRCAPWTREQQVDPIGSAGTYDTFLLVESPQPWPNDVSEIPALAAAASRDERTRVLAVVPRLDDDSGRVRVVHWRRGDDGTFAGLDHRCDAGEIPALLERLIDDPDGAATSAVGEAPTEVLLCTHGKRDACCGRWGTLLHIEATARLSSRVRTWRCSHTGGHRFAPTGLTFPDGRAWGFLDADVLEGIVTRSIDTAALREHYRGSTQLDQWGQVVERELFVTTGWSWLGNRITSTSSAVAEDGRSAEVAVAWQAPDGTDHAATGVVEVVRDVPVLVCGLPPEAAKKTSPELALRSLDTNWQPTATGS